MVQKRIRKASLSQALRDGQERHLSDGLPVVDQTPPKPVTATVTTLAPTPLTPAPVAAAPEFEVRPQPLNHGPQVQEDTPAVAASKPPYDPILPFVAPILRPQSTPAPVAAVTPEPSPLPEPAPTVEAPIAAPLVDVPPAMPVAEERFRVAEVVKVKPEVTEAAKFTPTPESVTKAAPVQKEPYVHKPVSEPKPQPQPTPNAQAAAPTATQSANKPSETSQKPISNAMNKPIIPPVSEAPTSLSSLGRATPIAPRHLRHSITDDELEILNAAKTRIEMRLFWVSMGIAIGSSIGAIPSLMLFNQTHILSLSGFFQNILFFAFTLLSLVLGVILVVKSQDIRRAYRDITERSRARDD